MTEAAKTPDIRALLPIKNLSGVKTRLENVLSAQERRALVRAMAEDCGARVLDLIGSGYNREVLAQSWLALIAGLADIDVALEEPVPAPAWLGVDRSLVEVRMVIQDVKNHLRDHWRSLR